MKKALLLSIRPQWLAKILNGEKIVEIRKRVPKWVLAEIAKGNSVDVYCYCTKGKPFLMKLYENKYVTYDLSERYRMKCDFNGLVPCKFVLREVDEITYHRWNDEFKKWTYRDGDFRNDGLLKKSGLNLHQLNKYLQTENGLALYITDLEIFDVPMELGAFCKINLAEDKTAIDIRNIKADCEADLSLTKAPQSMQTVYVNE